MYSTNLLYVGIAASLAILEIPALIWGGTLWWKDREAHRRAKPSLPATPGKDFGRAA